MAGIIGFQLQSADGEFGHGEGPLKDIASFEVFSAASAAARIEEIESVYPFVNLVLVPIEASDIQNPTYVGFDPPSPHDDALRKIARDTYGDDGTLEVDPNARISRTEDGAWVEAFVFVRNTWNADAHTAQLVADGVTTPEGGAVRISMDDRLFLHEQYDRAGALVAEVAEAVQRPLAIADILHSDDTDVLLIQLAAPDPQAGETLTIRREVASQ